MALAERVLADWQALVDQDAGSALLAPTLRTLVWCDRLEPAEEIYAQVVANAVERGHVATCTLMSAFRSECAFRRGDVADAEAYAREASAAATVYGIGMGVAYAAAFLAQALVELGRLGEAVAALGPLWAGEVPFHLAFSPALYVRGLLRLAQGDASGALADLLACRERQEAWECLNPPVMPWRSKAAERGERSLSLLAEAVATLEGSSARLELAHALVDHGTALRHAGRRVEAREPLRRGLDLAGLCGTTVLATRAHDELITCGARPRRERLAGIEALTARELRVARLAAQGLTNRHIAQQLFLSTKTVAVHLTRAYQKLDITTRADLPRALEPGEGS